MQKNKFYITTSIAYTNAKPHIGYALELLQADALARHHRQKGDDVFFLTGTDEHGKKIQEKAQSENKDTQAFVDEISSSFRELGKTLEISNDFFIRTTDKKTHLPAV
ncbi:class I tRNA ligase family protein, partial [Candidatus Azambacteria bacterium]|nr:class I tRNA ligase family protein [Candidatus Azambacteria bacterium]